MDETLRYTESDFKDVTGAFYSAERTQIANIATARLKKKVKALPDVLIYDQNGLCLGKGKALSLSDFPDDAA